MNKCGLGILAVSAVALVASLTPTNEGIAAPAPLPRPTTQPATRPGTQPATRPAGKAPMIFWEKQDGEAGGGTWRLTLWADGRSQITVRLYGHPGAPKPGWTAHWEAPVTVYVRQSPLPPAEAREKFNAALSAGIDQLRTFKAGYYDGSATKVGIEVGGQVKETIIPMFRHKGEPDNAGSENHKRFLAVDSILGNFDTDAVERN